MKKTFLFSSFACAVAGFAIINSSCKHEGTPDTLPSGIVKADFDTNVKPQQDFYNYVNGNWLKKNPIPADMPSWGGFTTLYIDVFKQLHTMLDDVAAHPGQPGSIEQKLGDSYSMAIDSAKQPKEGIHPLD